MNPEEQVLVIQREVFDELGAFHGLQFDVDHYVQQIFADGVPRFMPRGQMETDPSHKQIIPYVLMTHQGRVLSYVRGKRAGETRLVGQRSIGIGGHINPIDNMPLLHADFFETYLEAVKREVEEEVHVQSPHSDSIVALLNDDTNEVGRVHLGVVHLWQLDEPSVERREQMITQLEFLSPDQLRNDRESLETWSALCLDQLDAILEGHSQNTSLNK